MNHKIPEKGDPTICLQTPAGVTLTCDLQYGHTVSAASHQPNLAGTVWSCERWGQSINHSVIGLPTLQESSPGVQPCPAEECETQSACHTLLNPRPRGEEMFSPRR